MLLLEPVQFWHWWALAGLMVIVEVFAPGVMFLWLGMAAGVVGGLLLLWPGLELAGQLLAFAALSVASVLAWRRWQRARPTMTDEPNLNRRGEHYIGQRATLVAPIVNGRGRVELGDSSWLAAGPELPAGSAVEVTAAEGAVLRVRPLLAQHARADGLQPTGAAPPERTPV